MTDPNQNLSETKPTAQPETDATTATRPEEFGGSKKPEPVRYGDWEINGKCVDF